MKSVRSERRFASRGWLELSFHLLQVKAFRVELGPDDLNLVDSLCSITEIAGWTETVWVRRGSQPHLVDPSICQVKPHLVPCTILAEVEGHVHMFTHLR